MSILFVMLLFGGLTGLYFAFRSRRGRISVGELRELRALPVTSIAAARKGRVKLSGVARGFQTEELSTQRGARSTSNHFGH